jgi:hypothetical protein
VGDFCIGHAFQYQVVDLLILSRVARVFFRVDESMMNLCKMFARDFSSSDAGVNRRPSVCLARRARYVFGVSVLQVIPCLLDLHVAPRLLQVKYVQETALGKNRQKPTAHVSLEKKETRRWQIGKHSKPKPTTSPNVDRRT